ncbi:hypothetical protein GBA52_009141 [Prunus armeniaca]|nr:hypothetical protein GBA52_009141 [Prunus armeniaca]
MRKQNKREAKEGTRCKFHKDEQELVALRRPHLSARHGHVVHHHHHHGNNVNGGDGEGSEDVSPSICPTTNTNTNTSGAFDTFRTSVLFFARREELQQTERSLKSNTFLFSMSI